MGKLNEKPPTIIVNHSREVPTDPLKKASRLAKIRSKGKSVAEQVAANMRPKLIPATRTLRGTRK